MALTEVSPGRFLASPESVEKRRKSIRCGTCDVREGKEHEVEMIIADEEDRHDFLEQGSYMATMPGGLQEWLTEAEWKKLNA